MLGRSDVRDPWKSQPGEVRQLPAGNVRIDRRRWLDAVLNPGLEIAQERALHRTVIHYVEVVDGAVLGKRQRSGSVLRSRDEINSRFGGNRCVAAAIGGDVNQGGRAAPILRGIIGEEYFRLH